MALENGLTRVKTVGYHIETLRRRRNWLVGRIAERQANGEKTSFFDEEVAAIDWALPVLEAEWDNVARLNREVQRVTQRLSSLEHNGVDTDYGHFEWSTT